MIAIIIDDEARSLNYNGLRLIRSEPLGLHIHTTCPRRLKQLGGGSDTLSVRNNTSASYYQTGTFRPPVYAAVNAYQLPTM